MLPILLVAAFSIAHCSPLHNTSIAQLKDTTVVTQLIADYLAQYDTNDHEKLFDQVQSEVGTTSFFQVGNWAKCAACRGVMFIVHKAFEYHKTVDGVKAIVKAICKGLHIEDAHVCQCVSTEFVDEILDIINELVVNPSTLCPLFIPGCGKSKYNPIKPWDVPLPNTPKPPPFTLESPPEGSPTMRILHLADFHVDYRYAEGAESDCEEPLCCRPRDGKGPTVKAPSGKWGSVSKCDIPLSTAEYIFQWIADHEQFDYIIFTGDVPPHNVWNQTHANQIEAYDRFTSTAKKYFGDKIMYPAIGNHETAPADSFEDTPVAPLKYRLEWLYENLYKEWAQLTNQSMQTVRKMGSYVTQVLPGLRLISLNTNFCRSTNFWGFINKADPEGILAWLISELQEAENAGDKVHIVAHNPPSECELFYSWSHVYYKIINRYENTVAGQFFGHTHQDQFQIFYEDSNPKKRPTNVMFMAPSLTTYSYQNSAYRIYTVDSRPNGTWSVLDFETKYLDINAANANSSSSPPIKLEYAAKADYGLSSLFPEGMNDLVNRMQKDASLLDKYIQYFRVSVPFDCGWLCKRHMLCAMQTAKALNFHFCHVDVPTPQDKALHSMLD